MESVIFLDRGVRGRMRLSMALVNFWNRISDKMEAQYAVASIVRILISVSLVPKSKYFRLGRHNCLDGYYDVVKPKCNFAIIIVVVC